MVLLDKKQSKFVMKITYSSLETNFTFDEIVDCDEAFVTGTFGGIIPVKKLEQRQLKSTNDNSLVYR